MIRKIFLLAFVLLTLCKVNFAQTSSTAYPGFSFPNSVPLPNVKFISGYANVVTTGNVDLYTVPANRKAFVFGIYCYNYSGSTSSNYAETKISGTYYRISATGTNTNLSVNNMNPAAPMVLPAGQTLSMNNTQQPLNCWAQIAEFDATSSLQSIFLTSFAASDNTIYTVTTGKTAVAAGGTGVGFSNFGYATSSAATIHWNYVASGGTAGATNQASAATAVASGGANSSQSPGTMNSGDFVSINTSISTAGAQLAWVTVIEQ
jgi:hypothetical protein